MNPPPPVYILSGGVGASAEQVVHTVLAQFPDLTVPVVTFGSIRTVEQIDQVLAQARQAGATVVHTLVETSLRSALVEHARREGVAAIDLMGALLERLSQVLGCPPLEHPGLYRQLHRDYFDRVAAIDFAMQHDDGQKPEDWPQAEALLLGVSRSGKTPLSMYLSVLGWKVANFPLVPGLALPPELFGLDRRRVIGLVIAPGQLLLHRQQRQSRLGAPGPSRYTDPEQINEELELARQVYRRGGFISLDVTDRPIESSADEVIRLLTRHFPET